jgi:HSP20 family molecular chaperone IbpA
MESITADFNDGILTIEISKKTPEPKVTKQIEINSKQTKKILKD